ncbi:hypothetical protein ABPG72_022624 [Tetrahymena utriculariae]
MNILDNFCSIHQEENNQIQFFCLNEEIPEELKSRLLCNYCLEDANKHRLILVSMHRLKNNNRIVSQWPPTFQDISQSILLPENLSKLKISYIEEYYENFKKQICEQLELQKKQDMMAISQMLDYEGILNKYNEISSFSQIQNIIEYNKNSPSTLEQQLNELIKQKYLDIDKNQLIIDSIFQNVTVMQEQELQFIQNDILQKIRSIQILQKSSTLNQIGSMVQSTFKESNKIKIKTSACKIQICPSQLLCGQVYSIKPIRQDKIYQFIIEFDKKPQNYICVGFEEEDHKNRHLGNQGRNSFIIGQVNSSFCSQLLKGNKNLQDLVTEQFVKYLVIEVKLNENKFYISDFPNRTSINCMNQTQYQFKANTDYYFTIQINNQDTQIHILSSKIIHQFTLE